MTKKLSMCLLMIFITLIVIISGAELIIRISKKYCTYSELNGWGYISRYNTLAAKSAPNVKYNISTPEFKFLHTINSEGFRDVEHQIKKNHKKRLLLLGDSFIAGIGTSDDKIVARLIEQELKKYKFDLEIISGGIPGSDTVTQYNNLTNSFFKYDPDYVVIAINSSDIDDIVTRGGQDRNQNGPLEAPKMEYIWKYSHLFRLIAIKFFHYNEFLIAHNELVIKREEAKKEIVKIYNQIVNLGVKNNFKPLMILFPYPYAIQDRKMTYSAKMETLLKNSSNSVVDSWPRLKHSFKDKKMLEKSYYPIDKHFNPYGYSIFSKVLADIIKEKLLTK